MAEPLAKADSRGKSRIARPHQAKPGASPRSRDDPQWLHQARIDTDPFERTTERAELDCPIGCWIEMLQRAAAAMAEMPARGIGVPRPGREPLDDLALASSAAAGAKPRADAIARDSEGQKDWLASVLGDTVSLRAESLDQKLDGIVCVSLILVERPGHYLLLLILRVYSRATRKDGGVVSGSLRDVESSMGQAFTEWGLRGVEVLRDRVAVLVIVDVMSFSTTVDVAVARGASVIPFPLGDRAEAQGAADAAGAMLAEPRSSLGAGFTLSPVSLVEIASGARLLLPSPNGSRLSLASGPVPVFTGCLRNAKAVAAATRVIAGGGAVGIVPAGEQWPDGSLRPAIEDLFGAGAILDALDLPLSAEARVARDAFRAAEPDLAALLRASVSGQELIDRGFAEDVEFAAALNVSAAAPYLRDEAYQAWAL